MFAALNAKGRCALGCAFALLLGAAACSGKFEGEVPGLGGVSGVGGASQLAPGAGSTSGEVGVDRADGGVGEAGESLAHGGSDGDTGAAPDDAEGGETTSGGGAVGGTSGGGAVGGTSVGGGAVGGTSVGGGATAGTSGDGTGIGGSSGGAGGGGAGSGGWAGGSERDSGGKGGTGGTEGGGAGPGESGGRLIVGATGVAFSASPGRSVLERNVVVYTSTQRTDIVWSATADQSWLGVSPSGKTGEPLTLVANPEGLAAGDTYFATVTVATTDSAIVNQETIRVGLHVLQSAPEDLSLAIGGQFVATSPVEPLAFVSNGGTDVAAYNVFTGARARLLSGLVANAGAITLSGDGRTLFVFDRNNLRVQAVDASTGARGLSFAAPGASGSGLLYFRPAGYPTLVVPSSELYDVTSGMLLEHASLLGSYSLMASADGAIVVNDSGTVYAVTRSGAGGRVAAVEMLFNTGTAEGRVGQACLSADGTTVYTASGYPYNFPGVSFTMRRTVQVLPGSSYPNSILCAWNNLIIGGIDGYYDAHDIWVKMARAGSSSRS